MTARCQPIGRYLVHIYLLVWFVRPVVLDVRVTKVLHLIQHGLHQGGAKLSRVVSSPLTLVIKDVLTLTQVVVEPGDTVQEHTTTLHVPSSASQVSLIDCKCALIVTTPTGRSIERTYALFAIHHAQYIRQ